MTIAGGTSEGDDNTPELDGGNGVTEENGANNKEGDGLEVTEDLVSDGGSFSNDGQHSVVDHYTQDTRGDHENGFVSG